MVLLGHLEKTTLLGAGTEVAVEQEVTVLTEEQAGLVGFLVGEVLVVEEAMHRLVALVVLVALSRLLTWTETLVEF